MPLSKEHEKQKVKNYTMLAVLVGLVLIFFIATIVKYSV